jgi:hypothetical protein
MDHGEVDPWMMPFSSSSLNYTFTATNFSLTSLRKLETMGSPERQCDVQRLG